jgi:phospholipid/cholesterol/gamma-HCH transport system substrate-binding protein
MESERWIAVGAGAFVLATLALFAAAVLSLSQERGFWRPQYRLVTHFDNVQGLVEGAPVRLAGKDVGTVESVSFGPLGGEHPPVRVVLRIDAEVQDRIRSDSSATIGTIGLLGDRYVEVSLGGLEGSVLAEGSELSAVSPPDIAEVVARGREALSSVAELAGNLNHVVKDFDSTMGGRRIAESAAGFAEFVEEIRTGEGLLHSLIYDRYQGSGVESIESSLATLENILAEIRHGDGVLHTLIYGRPADQDLVMQALEAGAHLNSILEKVDRGEGTLGLVVSDPTLYEDLKLLLGGAQRSLVVRSLIRMSTDGGQ